MYQRAPLSCSDLAARGLASESYCCRGCHDTPRQRLDGGGMRAVFVLTPTGDVEAEICCAQARALFAHHAISEQIEEA